MRENKLLYFLIICGVIFTLLAQAGCMSVNDSPSPRLYMPRSLDKAQAVERFSLSSKAIIGVGPVKIPEYLNRPHMVTREGAEALKFAQFDRWAEPLNSTMLRLLYEDLLIMLPETDIVKFSWNLLIPVKYQVIVDVIQMEGDLNKDLFLLVSWSVLDLERRQLVFTRRSEFRRPISPNNYFGLCEALSASFEALSSEIARELAGIA